MDTWKILGGVARGVAIGVGAIAAAPFTGGGSVFAATSLAASLTGAGTIAAAVGAGTVGAGVGAKMAYDEEQEKEEEQRKQAEQNLRVQMMDKALKHAEPQLKEQEDYFNLLKAMTAVGIACADADGEISPEEKEEIEEFVNGVMSTALPERIKEDIRNIYQNPPRLKIAFDMVQQVKLDSYEIFDQIIDITIAADHVEHDKEIEFKQDWEQLKRIS